MTNRAALLTGLLASVAFIMPAAAQNTTDIGQINVEGTAETAPGAGYIIQEDSPKERSTVSKAAIDHQPASANIYQLMSRLPGVNSYSTDATGLFGGTMSIRGFNSDEIGVTVAGVPINDSGNYAVYPNELIDSENLLEVDVNQGSPDIDQPQGGAVGGAISLVPEDPTDLFRIKVVQSVGELNFFKSFIRLDTGKIADTGLKAFISYSKAETDKFKGPGDADKDHIDFGAVYETEQGSRFTLNSFFNSEIANNIRGLSLAQYRQYGPTLDYEPNLPANPFPVGVKGTAQNWSTVPAGFPSAYPGQTYSYSNYYKYQLNPFNNEIASFTADIKVLDNLHVTVQPYYWNGFGTGGGQFHTLAETAAATGVPGGLDLNHDGDILDTVGFIESSVTSTQRPGVNTKIAYQPVDWDTIKFGLDFDHSRHHQTAPYEQLNLDGSFASPFVDQNLLTRPNGTLIQFREQTTFNDTKIAFLEDTASLLEDALKITLGIKRAEVNREGTNNLPVAVATGNPNIIHPHADYVNYLPQISASYHITPENSVFANLQKNARAPSNYTLYESAQNTINDQIQETSWNLDVGYRYQTPDILASLSLFAVNFQNRQLDIAIPGDISQTTDINAGSVHNRGVELELGTAKPVYGFNLYGSAAYTKSTIQSNLLTFTGLIPIDGKNYPDTPKWQVSGVVEYLPEILPGSYISLSPKYTSSRYATLINDEKAKGFVDVDLAAGYKFADGLIDQLHNVAIQFNVQNLLDRDYLFFGFGNSSTGINAQSVKLANGKTVSGTAPTYSVGAPRFFSVKLSAEFGAVAEVPAATAAYVPPPVVAPMAAPKSYLVFFDFNKSDLTPAAVTIVNQAAANAGPAHVTKLEVTGHTDTVGSDAYNMRLSRRRAESVAAQLEKDGIPAGEIAIFAKGKRDLLVPTADGVKEPQNRRVQIVYSDGASS
jgi:iron complex outermembrane receptor protein